MADPITDPYANHRPTPETLKLLCESGAHLVRLAGTRTLRSPHYRAKDAFTKGWTRIPETLSRLTYHVSEGGLVGFIPGSLNLLVLDIDIPESAKAPDSDPHPLTQTTLETLHVLFGIEPVFTAGTYSGGLHAFYRCPKGTLPDTFRESEWAFQLPGERPLSPDGDIRYRKTQVVLWNRAEALAAAIRRQMSERVEFPIITEMMLADIDYHAVPTKTHGFDKPFFDIKIDALDTQSSWFNRIDGIEPREGGIHGLFRKVISSLFHHRAHSPGVLRRVLAKYKECLKARGPRKYDPDELYRIGVWALEKAVESALERFKHHDFSIHSAPRPAHIPLLEDGTEHMTMLDTGLPRGVTDLNGLIRHQLEWEFSDLKFDGETRYSGGTGYIKQADGNPLIDVLRSS